jgi:hypothetical protein
VLLREGIDTLLTGDIDTGKAIMRDYKLKPARRRRASSGCSVRAAIRRPSTCLASLAIHESRRASSYMWWPGRDKHGS